jgi:hypothetical protein
MHVKVPCILATAPRERGCLGTTGVSMNTEPTNLELGVAVSYLVIHAAPSFDASSFALIRAHCAGSDCFVAAHLSGFV